MSQTLRKRLPLPRIVLYADCTPLSSNFMLWESMTLTTILRKTGNYAMMLHHSSPKPRRKGMFAALAVIAIGCLTASATASTRVDLNQDWHFRTDPAHEGVASGWTGKLPTTTEPVHVPHTWNIGAHDDYEGVAWYFHSFVAPAIPAHGNVELHFDATFYQSHVFLNGKELGRHEGGHTAYFFDITKEMHSGLNYIAVELDNRPGYSTIPGLAMKLAPENIWYDWWHYGGIVRDVYLTVGDTALIRRQKIVSNAQSGAGTVTTTVQVETFAGSHGPLHLTAQVIAPDGSTAATSVPVNVGTTPATSAVPVSVTVPNAQLWSVSQPNVYSLRLELANAAGEVLDTRTDNFGFRKFEIENRHLLLNGERVRLSGMTRHEESPNEGLAETAGTMLHDWRDLSELHVTLTRPVHYPQNDFILDYADRHGIVLIPEIPIWQYNEDQFTKPEAVALAKQMMTEMIEQDGNHPSIMAWSISNESSMSTPPGKAYVKEMKEMIHRIDPGRFITWADNEISYGVGRATSAGVEADFIMMNQYYGAWNGPEEGLGPLLDRAEREFPDKMFIISEFGTPGVFAHSSADADKLRVHIIESQMEAFAKRDWIAGAIFWCYQDYKSHRNLWPGNKEGYVDHGVVDEKWQRRPSFEVWKHVNEPALVTATWTADSNGLPVSYAITATQNAATQLPSFTIRGYQLTWELRDGTNKLLQSGTKPVADLGAPMVVSERIEHGERTDLTLSIKLRDDRGDTAAEKTLTYVRLNPGGQNFEDMSHELKDRAKTH